MANILIVGANSGIGFYMVKQFLEQGDCVAVLDIHTNNLEELKEQYRERLHMSDADATDEASLSVGVDSALGVLGNLDIAIHNACLCTFESEPNTDYETYRKVFDVGHL